MPTPVSFTVNFIVFFLFIVYYYNFIVIKPYSVNLIALEIKLFIIYVIRRSSEYIISLIYSILFTRINYIGLDLSKN